MGWNRQIYPTKRVFVKSRIDSKITYFLFFLHAFFLPPVARLLCMESLEIPAPPCKKAHQHRRIQQTLLLLRIENSTKQCQIKEQWNKLRSLYPFCSFSLSLSLITCSLPLLKPCISFLLLYIQKLATRVSNWELSSCFSKSIYMMSHICLSSVGDFKAHGISVQALC